MVEANLNIEKKSFVRSIRIGQAIFLGIFTLGLSMMGGDLSEALHIPVSSLSLTTTLFGAMGALVCELFARRAEKW